MGDRHPRRRGSGGNELESARAEAIAIGIQRAQFEHAIAVLAGVLPADLSIAPAGLGAAPPLVPAELPSVLLSAVRTSPQRSGA